jgi:A/G-specific adenine glycosylase
MVATLRRALLAFYDEHKRDLPWRATRDPYAIWISEIMLQQTQVDVVKPRYAKFMALFPSVKALARASEAQVCEAWAGLGYYRRARNLHKAAQQLVHEHGGEFPRSAKELQRLAGIGRYTSGAIASIAFGEEAPIVDGNVARVLARIFMIEDAPDTTPGRKATWALATDLAKGPRPGDLNQALMELGATVCTPRSPKCVICPAARMCKARLTGEESLYPRPVKQAKTKLLPLSFAICEASDGVYLRQRPLDGLWPGLWEPPSADSPAELAALVGAKLGKPIGEVTHQLSHRDVRATIYRVRRVTTALALEAWENPLEAPLSALARKVLIAAKIGASK